MREKIILAPGVKGSELIKSLGLNGVNCFNVRICGAGELARIAMMRSGMSIPENFLSAKEEIVLFAKAVAVAPYFGKATYSDVREIAGAVNRMRSLVTGPDEAGAITEIMKKGIFEEKNDALVKVYEAYIGELKEADAVDLIALVRRAFLKCTVMDADFATLEEFPLSPLESALLERLSGGKAMKGSLRSLLGKADSESVKVEGYRNCYGAPNEVETVLADAYDGKALDQCVVAVTDGRTYGQLFFDYALLHDVPMTFGCGIPIINSNPARLLELYLQWTGVGFFGADAIIAMLRSPAFDSGKLFELFPKKETGFKRSRFYSILGGLRFTNDYKVNAERLEGFQKALLTEEELTDKNNEKDMKAITEKKAVLPALEIMAKELALPQEEFISKYAYLRKAGKTNAEMLLAKLDQVAAGTIYEELRTIRGAGIYQSVDDVILNLLKTSVCRQGSEAGKLHVTSVAGALSCLRKNLYMVGLSANRFPGSPTENYLLLDDDLMMFGEAAGRMTSNGKVNETKRRFEALLKTFSSLDARIIMSYTGMNVSELKKENASSLFFESFRADHGADASIKDMENTVEKVDYFAPPIGMTREIGKAYNRGAAISRIPDMGSSFQEVLQYGLENEYSPSALDIYFSCPRSFFIAYILGIPEKETKDPFEVISAKDVGTLAHTMMEQLGESKASKEEFLKLSAEAFERFLSANPPLIAENAINEKEQFLDLMEAAYDMDPGRKAVLKEEDLHCVHETGIKLRGFPDRVELLEDGTCLIVDYKTKRAVEHLQDDVDTCLQVLVYAYLMEANGYKVSGCEYRYVRLGETVTCRYDEEMKKLLTAKLDLFKTEMQNGFFSCAQRTEDVDPCKYCKYGNICGRDE